MKFFNFLTHQPSGCHNSANGPPIEKKKISPLDYVPIYFHTKFGSNRIHGLAKTFTVNFFQVFCQMDINSLGAPRSDDRLSSAPVRLNFSLHFKT